MAKGSVLPASQRNALVRLSALPIARELYLAGGVAASIHLGHRTSRDLDFFGYLPDLDLDRVRAEIFGRSRRVEVVARTDAALHLRFEGTDLDVVRYPYPLLVRHGATSLASGSQACAISPS
jgi:hypothetical protein